MSVKREPDLDHRNEETELGLEAETEIEREAETIMVEVDEILLIEVAIDIVKEEFVNHGEIGYKYHVYGVGRVGSPANFMVSHDNGNTFTSKSMDPYCSAMFDIKMFNKSEGFACAIADIARSGKLARAECHCGCRMCERGKKNRRSMPM